MNQKLSHWYLFASSVLRKSSVLIPCLYFGFFSSLYSQEYNSQSISSLFDASLVLVSDCDTVYRGQASCTSDLLVLSIVNNSEEPTFIDPNVSFNENIQFDVDDEHLNYGSVVVTPVIEFFNPNINSWLSFDYFKNINADICSVLVDPESYILVIGEGEKYDMNFLEMVSYAQYKDVGEYRLQMRALITVKNDTYILKTSNFHYFYVTD